MKHKSPESAKNSGIPEGRATDWPALQGEIAKKLNISIEPDGTIDGLKSAIADSDLLNLHAHWGEIRGSCAEMAFRPQDVEPLLEQAASILDRAFADRASWQALGEKYVNLKLDLAQYFALYKISLDEEAAGRYDVDARTSAAQENSNLVRQAGLIASLDKKKSQGNKVTAGQKDADDAADVAGRNQYINGMMPDCGAWLNKTVCWPFTAGGVNYSGRNTPDVAFDLSKRLYAYDQVTASLGIQAEQADIQGQIDACNAMKPGNAAAREWNAKNAEFLRHRANATRNVMRMKAALTYDGSLLDFAGQMFKVVRRYIEQVDDAYARLKAVETGLKALYAYSLAGTLDPLPPLTKDLSSFDDVVSWTRRVAAWLAAFTRRCHNYVLTLSVRHLAASKWDGGKANLDWTFCVPTSLFDENERHIRIRGMCGWCVGADGPYVLDCWPPTDDAMVRFERGDWTRLDQKVARFRIGRVLKLQSATVPEVSGLTALFNASPVGTWRVKATSPGTDHPSAPDDFFLDLYLSVLTV